MIRAIAVGLIMAIWDMPLWKIIDSLTKKDELTFSFACIFTLLRCVESIIYTWLFKKDNSVWPVTIAHETMNFIMQIIVMPFTKMYLSGSTAITLINEISLTVSYLTIAIGIILFEKIQIRRLSA